MAWTLIAHTQAGGPGDVTTSAIDTTGADLIVVATVVGGVLGTVSDNKGNSYALAVDEYDGVLHHGALYYNQTPSVGTGHAITLTGATVDVVSVQAWSGSIASPLDQTNRGQGSSPFPLPSITPVQDGELLVTVVSGRDSSTTFSIDSGFTITDQAPTVPFNNYGGAMAYLVQSAAASIAPAWTDAGGSTLDAAIVSFKAGPTAALITSDIVSPVVSRAGWHEVRRTALSGRLKPLWIEVF